MTTPQDVTWACDIPSGWIVSDGYGPAVTDCRELADGTLWVGNDEYGSRVNFCPFTGRKARTPLPEPTA